MHTARVSVSRFPPGSMLGDVRHSIFRNIISIMVNNGVIYLYNFLNMKRVSVQISTIYSTLFSTNIGKLGKLEYRDLYKMANWCTFT